MYKRATYRIRSNEPLTETVYRKVVEGDTQYLTAPGQFVNIQLPGKFLRRPISICNWTKDALLLLVRVVGDKSAMGQFKEVKITGANKWSLFGELE